MAVVSENDELFRSGRWHWCGALLRWPESCQWQWSVKMMNCSDLVGGTGVVPTGGCWSGGDWFLSFNNGSS
ncbi:hypothetical protein TSUD_40510 [Trifolium subterraneum]|uniref:Uncharacterized protein n=1 Tax=Trifolium subterraneum TaxID=3900 RepID=A0A2Z6NAV6_TRISU|nr:hypothetical protein TSUD_40510 [Trifolium subterraneum]